MRAIVIEKFGGPENLVYKELAETTRVRARVARC
jgi:hypothetical protein